MMKNDCYFSLENLVSFGHRRRANVKWLLLALFIVGFMFIPSVSSAHSELVRSFPEAGELLDKPPEYVVAWFSEELDSGFSTIQVIGPDERRVDPGDGGVDLSDIEHKRLIANLPEALSNGTYTVYWRAMSAEDGDLTEGEFTFSLNTESGGKVRPNAYAKKTTIPLPVALTVTVIFVVISVIGYAGWKRVASRKLS